MTDLNEYLNNSIEKLFRSAWQNTFSNPKESAFLAQMLFTQKAAAQKRSARASDGLHVPPFLIASIASQCNLHCSGCYARAIRSCCDKKSAEDLPAQNWNQVFEDAAKNGVSFILLAGGEPLMRKDILEYAAKIPELIFPVFTNGTMIDQAYLRFFNENRNLIPVLSIEGEETNTDARRGRGTYRLLMNTMEEMTKKGIFYGSSITVTRENLSEVSGNDFVRRISEKGCKLIFYVEYVPAQPGTEKLAPTVAERSFFSDRLEELRNRYPSVIFLSFPGDEKKLGGCLAAGRGFFHINAKGDAEPCPFSPYSDTNMKTHSLTEAMCSPLFRKIEEDGLTNIPHNGGCSLIEKRISVQKIISKGKAQ